MIVTVDALEQLLREVDCGDQRDDQPQLRGHLQQSVVGVVDNPGKLRVALLNPEGGVGGIPEVAVAVAAKRALHD